MCSDHLSGVIQNYTSQIVQSSYSDSSKHVIGLLIEEKYDFPPITTPVLLTVFEMQKETLSRGSGVLITLHE